MTSTPYDRGNTDESYKTAFLGAASLLLGLLVAVLGLAALMMWLDARDARHDANAAAANSSTSGASMAGMDMSSSANLGSLTSYPAPRRPTPTRSRPPIRRIRPSCRRLLPVPSRRPSRPDRPDDPDRARRQVRGLGLGRRAPGAGYPRPRRDSREVTLTNNGAIPHSVDFHAARIAPDKASTTSFRASRSVSRFRANDAGVFMYHCGTKPVLMHIANGMYGAIVVDPKPGVLPKADKNYVLVASEWYLDSDGLSKPAQFNMAKAHARQPDWMTFNGYAGQYVTHPLTAKPGELVRFWVVDAGPSLDTDFHIVGTILNTAYPFGDMNPADALHNVQTVTVPAGGGGVFDVKIDQPGLYPFVSHSFAAVDEGQVGLLNVGNVKGTMSH